MADLSESGNFTSICYKIKPKQNTRKEFSRLDIVSFFFFWSYQATAVCMIALSCCWEIFGIDGCPCFCQETPHVFVINYIIFHTVLTPLGLNFSKVVSTIHVIRLRILSSLFRQTSEFSFFVQNWCGDKDTSKDNKIVFCVSKFWELECFVICNYNHPLPQIAGGQNSKEVLNFKRLAIILAAKCHQFTCCWEI